MYETIDQLILQNLVHYSCSEGRANQRTNLITGNGISGRIDYF